MACSYEIDRERQLVISTGSGLLTADEMFAHQNRLANDENFAPDFYQLLDFTAVTGVAADANEVQGLAARKVFSDRARRAFVATNTLQVGLIRMFETYRELAGGKEQMEIFSDRDEAMCWLFQGPEVVAAAPSV
jgi:hypothetical protein